MTRAAVMSPGGLYRYLLTREWDSTKDRLGWIMLNPSTADADKDDASSRLCMGWARRLGFGGINLANLFGLRSTNPEALYDAPDPVGPINLEFISYVLFTCPMVICAWGTHGNAMPGHPDIPKILRSAPPGKLRALRINKDGSPAHVLRIPYSTKLVEYHP